MGSAGNRNRPGEAPAIAMEHGKRPEIDRMPCHRRGEHIALAAPGVDLVVADAAASASGGVTRLSGTSYAAPYVSAAVALLQTNGVGRQGGDAVRAYLTKTSLDLGQTGFDPMYGHGLLQMNAVCKTPTAQTPSPARGVNSAGSLTERFER